MNNSILNPNKGEIYKNRNGQIYLCIDESPYYGTAFMKNTTSGWTFKAIGIRIWSDGLITWDQSTGGHFEETK